MNEVARRIRPQPTSRRWDQQCAPEEEDDNDEPEAHPGGRRTGGASRRPQTGGAQARRGRTSGCTSWLRATRRPRAASHRAGLDLGFFKLRLGACTVALDFGVFWLNEITTSSLDLYCATVCCNFSECNVDFTW